jgi:hypothetical protein
MPYSNDTVFVALPWEFLQMIANPLNPIAPEFGIISFPKNSHIIAFQVPI